MRWDLALSRTASWRPQKTSLPRVSFVFRSCVEKTFSMRFSKRHIVRWDLGPFRPASWRPQKTSFPPGVRDPPSLIQAGPDSKFGVPLLGVTSRRILSRHVASLRFTSLCFAFFCDFLRIFTFFCDFGSQNGGFWR